MLLKSKKINPADPNNTRNRKAQSTIMNTLTVLALTIVLISMIFVVTSSRFKKLTGTETSGALSYRYMTNTKLENPEAFLNNPEKIIFSKSNDKIAINEQLSMSSESCGDLDTSAKISDKTIAIDLGHGSLQDKGFVNTEKKLAESRITQGIGSVMNKELSSQTKLIFTRDVSKEASSKVEISSRKEIIEKADLGISIHVSEDIDTLSNKIIIYVNPESEKIKESKKLGCLMISKLTENFGEKITAAEIKESSYGENEVIPAHIAAVRIEIGNIKADSSLSIYENQDKIGKALSEAIKDYYSRSKKK